MPLKTYSSEQPVADPEDLCSPSLHDALAQRGPGMTRLQRHRAGETVAAVACDLGYVGSVVSGILRLIRTTDDGHRQIVAFLTPSDVFGGAFSEHEDYAVEAVTDATVRQLDRRAVEELLNRRPCLERQFMQRSLRALHRARELVSLLGYRSVRQRLAGFLLAELGHPRVTTLRPGDDLTLEIPRLDLANYLATSPESVCRSLRDLDRHGLITILDPGRFVIRDRQGLRQLAEGRADPATRGHGLSECNGHGGAPAPHGVRL
ncbi:Crp/Fnr family transcriptional regulator [Tranquillimonas alkanivorans]|uniref:CRP/FNR family transcriptional regulator, anaerobic regulatory protein n=1 Tax=Tranquillimonas alkanivorans TaxID=441119 RepID=A0A1I5QX35_9RHOB|nr:Crp/Fnr family transcriptional regulator [Tranquillimonas alkanivorans]SFP50366.1 CRP/FNR family transcriptional regulator, anaerobic regulatory protein [Tranquillimonas alkanivorans]